MDPGIWQTAILRYWSHQKLLDPDHCNHRSAAVDEQVSMMLFPLSTETSNFSGGI